VLHAVGVGVGQRRRELGAHARELRLADRSVAQHQRQRLPGDVLEDERALGVRCQPVDVVDLEQVRVVQTREVADLLDPFGEHVSGGRRKRDEADLAAQHLVDAAHGRVVDPDGEDAGGRVGRGDRAARDHIGTLRARGRERVTVRGGPGLLDRCLGGHDSSPCLLCVERMPTRIARPGEDIPQWGPWSTGIEEIHSGASGFPGSGPRTTTAGERGALRPSRGVEVPGIEPGSSEHSSGLLRAQSASSLLGSAGRADTPT
jgi:hypothetical protein